MNDEIPKAIWSGSFRLFGVDVKCHRLDSGQTIIEADSFQALMEAMADGTLDAGDIEGFQRFQLGEATSGER